MTNGLNPISSNHEWVISYYNPLSHKYYIKIKLKEILYFHIIQTGNNEFGKSNNAIYVLSPQQKQQICIIIQYR